MEKIEKNRREAKECMMDMLAAWLSGQGGECTKHTLRTALLNVDCRIQLADQTIVSAECIILQLINIHSFFIAMNPIKCSRTTRYVTLSQYYHVSSHESNTNYNDTTVPFSSYSCHELVTKPLHFLCVFQYNLIATSQDPCTMWCLLQHSSLYLSFDLNFRDRLL